MFTDASGSYKALAKLGIDHRPPLRGVSLTVGAGEAAAHVVTASLLGFVVGTAACYHLAQLADLVAARASDAPAVYRERCSNCHGAAGRGDGLAGRGLAPRPRDFADRAWQERTSEERIRFVIRNGGEAAGLSASMAAHGDLSDEELGGLVEFIRGVGGAGSQAR